MGTWYEHGQWNVICDRCGSEYKARQLRMEWTGLRVCSGPLTRNCWEPRHPQDFVRGVKDPQAPPWTRPEAADTFLTSREWNDDTKTWDVT